MNVLIRDCLCSCRDKCFKHEGLLFRALKASRWRVLVKNIATCVSQFGMVACTNVIGGLCLCCHISKGLLKLQCITVFVLPL